MSMQLNESVMPILLKVAVVNLDRLAARELQDFRDPLVSRVLLVDLGQLGPMAMMELMESMALMDVQVKYCFRSRFK